MLLCGVCACVVVGWCRSVLHCQGKGIVYVVWRSGKGWYGRCLVTCCIFGGHAVLHLQGLCVWWLGGWIRNGGDAYHNVRLSFIAKVRGKDVCLGVCACWRPGRGGLTVLHFGVLFVLVGSSEMEAMARLIHIAKVRVSTLRSIGVCGGGGGGGAGAMTETSLCAGTTTTSKASLCRDSVNVGRLRTVCRVM